MQPKSRFTYRLPYDIEPLELYLTTTQYSINSRTCIQAFYYDSECQGYLPYATLTVNLPDCKLHTRNAVFLDLNNCPWVVDMLQYTLQCGMLTGFMGQSGWCLYPEFELFPEVLAKYIYNKED